MTAPTPDPTAASIGEQIAAAIEANWAGDEVYDAALEDAARIAREFTPTVDGAAVDEAIELRSLPVGSVVLDRDGDAWQQRVAGGWTCVVRGVNTEAQPTGNLMAILAPFTAVTVPTSPTVTGGDNGLRDPESLAKLLYVLNEAETGAMTWDELLAVDGEQTNMVVHYRAVAEVVLERLAAHPAPTVDEAAVDPVCVCGSELSLHSGWEGHSFVDAEGYFDATVPTSPTVTGGAE